MSTVNVVIFLVLLFLAMSCKEDPNLPPILPDQNTPEHVIAPFCIDAPNEDEEAKHSHTRFCGKYNLTLGGKLSESEFEHMPRPYPHESYIVLPVSQWYDIIVYLTSKGVIKRVRVAWDYIVKGTIPVQWRRPPNHAPASAPDRHFPRRGMPVHPLTGCETGEEGVQPLRPRVPQQI